MRVQKQPNALKQGYRSENLPAGPFGVADQDRDDLRS